MLDARMNEPAEVAELALFVAAHGRFSGEDVGLGGGAGLENLAETFCQC